MEGIEKQRFERAKKLKQLRELKGISKSELSRSSGLSRTTIDKMESGRVGWNIDCEIIYQNTLNFL